MNKNFCPAPWVSLYFEPSGEVDNCCIAKNRLGNYNLGSIQTVIFSEKNKQIKQDMLDDKYISGCKSCSNKSDSLQASMINMFYKDGDPLYDNTDNFNLQYLDARWTNTCNLACAYCSPEFSSVWAQELKQEIKLDKSAKDKLLDYVLQNVKTLKNIYMAGGEPLLMKENELLISALKEHNPTCNVLVNTNLTQVKSSKIFTSLLELKNVRWLISVESMHEQFEYIRYPAKWDDFSENLNYLRSHTLDTISFHMVLTALNGLEFWNTVDWLITQEFDLRKMTVTLYNNGAYPGPLDVRNLPIEHQQQILDRMCSNPNYKKIAGWQNVYDYLSAKQTMDTELWWYLAGLDKRRNLNSQTVFPEIYKYKDTQ